MPQETWCKSKREAGGRGFLTSSFWAGLGWTVLPKGDDVWAGNCPVIRCLLEAKGILNSPAHGITGRNEKGRYVYRMASLRDIGWIEEYFSRWDWVTKYRCLFPLSSLNKADVWGSLSMRLLILGKSCRKCVHPSHPHLEKCTPLPHKGGRSHSDGLGGTPNEKV